jgi:hypothetical protein
LLGDLYSGDEWLVAMTECTKGPNYFTTHPFPTTNWQQIITILAMMAESSTECRFFPTGTKKGFTDFCTPRSREHLGTS